MDPPGRYDEITTRSVVLYRGTYTSISVVARELNTARQTIMWLRDEAKNQALQAKEEASLSENRRG
ncbi:hypothetical protein CO704_25415 (plasmid) [Cedecea neteri]|uniref:Uncharacterized protein n=1 Tax=Cedecea neteri TaxID=158822 RepID=A0A291E671_9ENTR|nr:hypothetical protein CO704_25415 [Cedecea neteri]